MSEIIFSVYSAILKKKILLFDAAWMDLENITLIKISQSEKDKEQFFNLQFDEFCTWCFSSTLLLTIFVLSHLSFNETQKRSLIFL